MTAASVDHSAPGVHRGVRWNALGTYGSQTVWLVSGLVLARLLAPEWFGLFAMAQVFIGVAGTVWSLGLGPALIQHRAPSPALLSSAFFFALCLGILLSSLLGAASPLLAAAYQDAAVAPVVLALSPVFALRALGLVPGALLVRRLAFRQLALIELADVVLSALAAIALAWRGAGVWALVCPALLGPLVQAPLLFVASRWRPRLVFSPKELRGVLRFGANLAGSTAINYLARNVDKFLIGRILGAIPLSFYALAYRVLLFPRDAVSGTVTRVLMPALARLQDDDARLGEAYLRACAAIALVTFPMMLGVTVVAEPLVLALLGARWAPAVPLLWVLAPLGLVQSITTTTGSLYLAKGRTDWLLRWEAFTAVIFVGSFVVGLRWGALGVAVGYALANLLVLIPWFAIPFGLVAGLSLRGLLRVLAPSALHAGLMASLVLALRLGLEAMGATSLGVLIASAVVGVACYAALVLWQRPPALRDLDALLGRGRGAHASWR